MKNSEKLGWLGRYRSTSWFGLVLIATMAGLSACKPASQNTDKRLAAYQARLQACVDSMENKTRIPIMGGGEIDTSRFAFNIPHMNVTDEGECGAVGFEAEFYWTGEKIVPNAPKFTSLHLTQIPPEWRLLRVGASLGNRRLGNQCKAHFDPQKCPDPNRKPSGPPPTWPEHLTVRSKTYPGLEMRLTEKRSTNASYFIVGWPRRDGVTPRVISCWSHEVDFPVHKMTIAELEQLDFGKRTFPCDVEYGSFDFKGGGARVHHSTALLPSVVPALKALQQYLSDSIIKED